MESPPGCITHDRSFRTLDALRGIAAIGVVLYHAPEYFAPIAAPSGYLAVDLFFMMSGIVITHAYDGKLRAGMSVGEFMRIRSIRLGPLYALGLLLGLAMAAASLHGGNSEHWTRSTLLVAALLGALFVPNLTGRPNEKLFPLNVPCWSLWLELLVNLLFGLCAVRLKTRNLGAICLVSGAIVIVSVLRFGSIDLGYVVGTLAPGVARTIFGFSVGVLIGRQQATRSVHTFVFLALCGAFVMAILGHPQGWERALWDAGWAMIGFPAIVWAAVRFEPPAWLRSSATFLGLTSYAVYVLATPLTSMTHSILKHTSLQVAPFVGFAFLGALLVASWWTDRYYDSPVRRWLSGRNRGEVGPLHLPQNR